MSGQQPEKTRERGPANLGVKFNPNLGAANMKRFHATVRALLKSNEQSGELALAVLEGRANSSKQSLVLFEPREIDYDKVVAVLKETNDEAKALAAGKDAPRRGLRVGRGRRPVRVTHAAGGSLTTSVPEAHGA